MAGFSAAWLDLREPVDAAARSRALRRRVAHWCRGRESLRIVDLGAGTGSGLRWLAPVLPGVQHWWLIDHDAELLAALPERLRHWAEAQDWSWRQGIDHWCLGEHVIHAERRDLLTELDALPRDGVDLVSASALLDLVSADWLAHLVERYAGAALYCTLNVDGELRWNPELAGDERVRALFNRHQRGAKGFGPALGASAVDHLAGLLRARGYAVATAASPWRLGPDQEDLQQALLAGYRSVVEEWEPAADWLADWLAQRRSLLDHPHGWHRVGHGDLFAWPSRRSKSNNTSRPMENRRQAGRKA